MLKDQLKNPFVDRVDAQSGSIFTFEKRFAAKNDKYNPHSSNYIFSQGSGSFTAQIDPFRQGVSVINEKLKIRALLPTFDTEDLPASGSRDKLSITSGIEEKLIIGQTKFHRSEGPFNDKVNLEKIGETEGLLAFAKGNIPTSSFVTLDYPIIQAGKKYHIGNLLNGIIDTFDRTYDAATVKIYSRSLSPIEDDPYSGIKADIMEGNSSYKRGSDNILPLIPLTGPVTSSSPFVDRGTRMSQSGIIATVSGSIRIPDSRHSKGKQLKFNDQFKPQAFDDSKFASRIFTNNDLKNLSDDFFYTVVENISGSSAKMIPEGFKSATSGFIFNNNGLNIDSIAYGGMKRDA